MVRTEFDKFLKYGEDKLVELGILGAPIAEGGLINVTGLQRLHNGAIWQQYVRREQQERRIERLEQKLLEAWTMGVDTIALTQRLRARTEPRKSRSA